MISASAMLSVTELVSLLDVNDSEDQLVQDGELRSLDLNEAALADVDPMLERSRLISRGFVSGRERHGLVGSHARGPRHQPPPLQPQ